ncbi:MAG: hypothetical protein SD837_11850 [Candidatus Electrothrix scaldis]|nr:MAG: hypothetical protein SD837_11850 [Candidatus Electrothrix sp. GW3-3]
MQLSLFQLPKKLLNRMKKILDKNENSVKVYLLSGTCPDEEGIQSSRTDLFPMSTRTPVPMTGNHR